MPIHRALLIGPIKGMVTPEEPSLDPSKLIILTFLKPFWMCAALGDILISIVSNFQFGKRPGPRNMTIFKFGYTPTEGGIFRKNPVDPYISNDPVQSGPARRPAWRQHIIVTALIVPRTDNVNRQIS